jgi:hypothetical protein
MFKNPGNKIIMKRVEGKPELAPNLVISVKQISPKKYEISILHPNTKKALYCKNHVASSMENAFLLGKEIKKNKFSDTKTYYEEILFIPRPKRGKMKLHLKEDDEKNE